MAVTEPDLTNPFTGRRLGRYLLRYEVAQGGMGRVYLAQLEGAHGFEKWVAVKVIHPHHNANRKFVNMFLDEARVAARIRHASVCAVTDFGEERGVLYMAMEYLHGETLGTMLRRAVTQGGGLPGWLAARVVVDAARGLHAAHELKGEDGGPLGLVHRDVSAQNIMVLYDGSVKVLDFGIARARGRLHQTRTGELKGKLAFMAPEQLERKDLDRRSDVWSLGVVLWEAITGRRLFRTDDEASTMLAIVRGKIRAPAEVTDACPKELSDIVMKLLQRDRDKRTESAEAVADQLERWLYSNGEPAGPAQAAKWMHAHLKDKLASREALLRAPALPVEAVPEVNLDSGTTNVSGIQDVGSRTEGLKATSRAWLWFATLSPARLMMVGAAVFLPGAAVVIGLVAWVVADGPPSPDKSPPPLAAAAVAPEPPSDRGPEATAPEAVVEASVEPLALPSPAVPHPPPDPAPAAPPEPAQPTTSTPSPRAVSTAPGALTVMWEPRSRVYLGRRFLGITPLVEAEVPAGTHRIELRPAVGGSSEFRRVTIQAGRLRRLTNLGSTTRRP